MNVKYQVFVSSTFIDLQEERRVLMEQILNLGHIPVGMELFQASNQEQWAYIQKRISDCDYYLLIVAERYGSIDSDGKSFTQKEYEFAIENKIPVASFLLSPDSRKTRRADFVEHERKDEVENFRKECSKSKMVSFWSSPGDLALKATNALLGLIREEPRLGWVRADNSAEGALRELAKLAEEKRELQIRLAELEGADKISIPESIKYHMEKLRAITVSDFVSEVEDRLDEYKPEDLLTIFVRISRDISIHVITNRASALVYNACSAVGGNQYSSQFSKSILMEYSAFGLVSFDRVVFGDSTREVVRMTDYGRNLLMYAEMDLEDAWQKDQEGLEE